MNRKLLIKTLIVAAIALILCTCVVVRVGNNDKTIEPKLIEINKDTIN